MARKVSSGSACSVEAFERRRTERRRTCVRRRGRVGRRSHGEERAAPLPGLTSIKMIAAAEQQQQVQAPRQQLLSSSGVVCARSCPNKAAGDAARGDAASSRAPVRPGRRPRPRRAARAALARRDAGADRARRRGREKMDETEINHLSTHDVQPGRCDADCTEGGTARTSGPEMQLGRVQRMQGVRSRGVSPHGNPSPQRRRRHSTPTDVDAATTGRAGKDRSDAVQEG